MGLIDFIDQHIADAQGEPVKIQELCESERQNRNEDNRERLLSPSFAGMRVDSILVKILEMPDYLDPRNNLCIWARPTKLMAHAICKIQDQLKTLAPHVWTTPVSSLHMTVLEIAHSQTPTDIESTINQLQPCLPYLTNVGKHPVILGKPQLSYDEGSVSVTFVPVGTTRRTYLHLRRDLARVCQRNGVEVSSRYFTTSSHITIARFLTTQDLRGTQAREDWIRKINDLNQWLKHMYWPLESERMTKNVGEWILGAESGLEIRIGRLWYGGGESILIGEPIEF
ncbi:RNA ligase/cyclic nucleotide phosphodiesterase [Whalleya microplaca]|nr:RNA ligase/cyclic nucleotide phosphodiesterase [Whalleya microplaca]